MPQQAVTDNCRKLEHVARTKQKEADEAEKAVAAARRREQVLADICRHTEEMLMLRARHKFHTDSGRHTPSDLQQHHGGAGQHGSEHSTPQHTDTPAKERSTPPNIDTPAGSLPSQHGGGSTTHLASDGASQAPTHRSNRGGSSTQQQQQQSHPLLRTIPPKLAAAMDCVPHFCCSSCLLQSAGDDTMAAALRLSVQDWSQLWVALVYELSLLLDLIQRQEAFLQHQQGQHAQRQEAGHTSAQQQGDSSRSAGQQGTLTLSSSGEGAATCFGTTGSSSVDPLLQQPGRHTCAACGQLLPRLNAQAVPEGTAADAAAAAAAVEEEAEEAESDLLAVQQLVEQFMGLAYLAGAVRPAEVTQAITLNHRTQRQQVVPDSHWKFVVQRLDLTAEQAAHLGECGAEVLKLLRSQSAALHRLTSLASGHSLLVLAADGGQQQQPQRLGQLQQQEWRHLLHDLQLPNASHQQAAALGPSHNVPLSASPHGSHLLLQQQQQQQQQQQAEDSELVRNPDAATAVVDTMDGHVSQLALWCFLLSYMMYDCLTPLQRAKLIVACYPWSLQPVPIALAAGELHAKLQQQEEAGQQHMGQQQQQQWEQQRGHQQQHRQQWWRECLGRFTA